MYFPIINRVYTTGLDMSQTSIHTFDSCLAFDSSKAACFALISCYIPYNILHYNIPDRSVPFDITNDIHGGHTNV